MEISNIEIENFKCFNEKTNIDLSRITLLTGANSSGKSSFIYSILGSLQSGEFPFQFSTNGKYVNMGDFKEIVNGHDNQKNIKINFKFSDNSISEINTVWKENPKNNLPQLFALTAISNYFNLNIRLKRNKYHIILTYNHAKDPDNRLFKHDNFKIWLQSLSSLIDSPSNKSRSNKLISADDFIDKVESDFDNESFIVDSLTHFKRKDISERAQFRLETIFSKISKLFLNYDERINFISSFRLQPDRTYLEQAKSKIKVNNFGDGYLDQIILWENENSSKLKDLKTILYELDLLHNIKSKRIGGGRYEINVQIKENSIDTSISDVGFGVSQFLPIIVADLQLGNDSTLYIAQPEIHLHPSIQSNFGNYLTNQITKTAKNYIIETHSEYLLNKLRLSIVKKEISSEDVNVYFIDDENGEKKICKIIFNEKGQIENAPENFFKTYMMDVMDIAINAVD